MLPVPPDDQGLILWSAEGPGVFWRFFQTDELGRFEKEIQERKSEVDAEILLRLTSDSPPGATTPNHRPKSCCSAQG